jgi:hypothetical protein
MPLPFTSEPFNGVFRDDNESVWPVHFCWGHTRCRHWGWRCDPFAGPAPRSGRFRRTSRPSSLPRLFSPRCRRAVRVDGWPAVLHRCGADRLCCRRLSGLLVLHRPDLPRGRDLRAPVSDDPLHHRLADPGGATLPAQPLAGIGTVVLRRRAGIFRAGHDAGPWTARRGGDWRRPDGPSQDSGCSRTLSNRRASRVRLQLR